MSHNTFPIESSHLELVTAYIQTHITGLSWWPAKQPWKAREEFEQLPNDPETLRRWCETWLDPGEWQQLKRAVQHSMSAPRS